MTPSDYMKRAFNAGECRRIGSEGIYDVSAPYENRQAAGALLDGRLARRRRLSFALGRGFSFF